LYKETEIRQVAGKRGFLEIYDDWHVLMEHVSSQCFYHHPSWFMAFFDRPGGVGEDILFRCAYQNGALVAVLPLVLGTRFGGVLREATLPAYDGLYLPDMAVSDDVEGEPLWLELSQHGANSGDADWDNFFLYSVLENSSIAQLLLELNAYTVRSSVRSRCAVIDIIDYEQARAALKKKFRGNLNNARNRLSAEDDVRFSCFTHPSEILPAYDCFVDLEQSGWKGNPEKMRQDYPAPAAIALKKSKYLFYRNVIREFSKLSSAEICLLRVGGKAIGAQIFLVLNNISYLVKTAFDEDSKGFSPGHMLLDFTYRRYASEKKIDQLYLITDYDWFTNWNPRYLDYLNIRAFAKTSKGRMARAAYSVVQALR